ncbi:S-adenosyl-L-methionine-dependent methyltransferase [Cryphonectria parasitica EP155]|uniref:S-adenosyl-L-methionine-dependent methyltransferase n=1 Tax=Cryphonectria parasitica (strain ATCC 38755 / EP155) TaxID=660469 RepID=A0A9P4Y0V0_CRYP1|nr:S-adenosyl-L-methionine-dependent methyltransferase [Cryphonectria parasitica EP155]KAF3764608.1 S-adenosyl-L-methionine-dependent methyltransferase [Cryphonectria parasitica EP155]
MRVARAYWTGEVANIQYHSGSQPVKEYGRTYHSYGEGKYYLPNDAHKLWALMFKGKLHLAPLTSPTAILDVGAGTGIWAMEAARTYPKAKVLGTDLSLIQPSETPPNCSFSRADAEAAWPFQRHFDFIHLRAVCTCFSDPKGVMQKVFDNLKPGGWCEYNDYVPECVAAPGAEKILQDSAFPKCVSLFAQGLANAGRDPLVTLKYKEWMEEIGFTDVVQKRVLCPIQ